MRFAKWFLPILVIGLILAAGTWLAFGESAAPDIAHDHPESAAISGSFPARGQGQAPVQAPSPEPPPQSKREQAAIRSDIPRTQPPISSFDQRMMVDEPASPRPERGARAPGPYGSPFPYYLPPWLPPQNDHLEGYGNAPHSGLLPQRDFYRRHRGNWMEDICPWTSPRRPRYPQPLLPWQLERSQYQEPVRDY